MEYDKTRRLLNHSIGKVLGKEELTGIATAINRRANLSDYSEICPPRLPTGAIPRYELQTPHDELLEANPAVNFVMIDSHRIPRLLGDNSTLGEWLLRDETKIITTTTFGDRELSNLTWEAEAEMISDLEPEIHIPCDYPIYPEMSTRSRLKNIEDLIHGTYFISEELEDMQTQILPLVTGVTRFELEIFSETLFSRGFDKFAFYGSQYYGNKLGDGSKYLRRDLNRAISICSPKEVLLIGGQSPKNLAVLPQIVTCAAGTRIIKESNKDDNPQETYSQIKEKIDDALKDHQKRLSEFGKDEVAA